MNENPFTTNTKSVADYRGVNERTIQRHCQLEKIPAVFRHGRWWISDEWWRSQCQQDRERHVKRN